MKLNQIILDYISNIKLMQLATCRDNKPWLCNVWYVMDDEANIYWKSRKIRRHSEDIKANPYASCTMSNNYRDGFGEKGQALVVAGGVEIISGQEAGKIYDLYGFENPKLYDVARKDDFIEGKEPLFFYKLTPSEIVWWDEVNHPNDPRQVIL